MVCNSRLYFLLLFILMLIGPRGFAQNKMRGPFKPDKNSQLEKYGEGSNTFLNFYQKWISPVKGGNLCPMHPSCSQYSKIAFRKNPPLLAVFLTTDRLMRCGHELHYYKEIIIDGKLKFHDPVPEEKNPDENDL